VTVSPQTLDFRARRRLVTRDTIAREARRLFLERGFDQVTIEEIAAAAEVGRMTVFNHFPRKEDMFFEHDEPGRELIRETIRRYDPAIGPLETMRLFAHELVGQGSPYIRFTSARQNYVQTIEASETLKSRIRAIRDEIAQLIAVGLAERVGRDPADAEAHLAADMLLATYTVAMWQAHRSYRQHADAGEAAATFLRLVDQGTRGIQAALVGTPYA